MTLAHLNYVRYCILLSLTPGFTCFSHLLYKIYFQAKVLDYKGMIYNTIDVLVVVDIDVFYTTLHLTGSIMSIVMTCMQIQHGFVHMDSHNNNSVHLGAIMATQFMAMHASLIRWERSIHIIKIHIS